MRFIKILSIAIIGIIILPHYCFAKNINSTTLTDQAITKGYTIGLNNRFKVGITPEAISASQAEIILQRIDSASLAVDNIISPIYSYDLDADHAQNLNQPLWLSIKLDKINLTNQDVILKYWDNNKGGWIAIPSAYDSKNRIIKAAIHLFYAQVAVFREEKNYQTGTATWYDWYGAASNDYPMGTKLTVTNLDNNKSTVVEVVSTGPFNRHIIDLPRNAFAEIGSISAGIIPVKVQPL